LTPERSIRVSDRAETIDLVASATQANATLALEGGGSKRGWGGEMRARWRVSLGDLAGIVRYEPEELVLTVRPGTRLAELDAQLAEHAQTLAFEPPHFGHLWDATSSEPTIGGTIACNASGPRRLRAGAARDHLLGAEFVNGRAEEIRTGGRVVKNVTGYDLCKLLAGSFGTLGIVTELTLKVAPRPRASASLALPGLDPEPAVRAIVELMATSAAPSAIAYLPRGLGEPVQDRVDGDSLVLARFEGSAAGVAERCADARRRIGGVTVKEEESAPAWARIRDALPFHDAPVLWRLAIPPASLGALASALGSNAKVRWLADWGGSLVWVAEADAQPDERIRAYAERQGGRALVFRAGAAHDVPVWSPQSPAIAALNERIRAGFDPAGIFNPGRLGG
jgi:glycolate oxidase FAD binding subunit